MSTDGTPENVLFEWYGRYIGDPETETDVYLGFALFFGGIALGAVGVLVFLLAAATSGPNETAFALREVAVVASSVGLPILLLGIVVLLPGDQRMTYAALGGLAVCLVAVALFVYAYPSNWNYGNPDYSAQGVAIYAVGLVAVIGSTGAALVGHQVERAAPAGGAEAGAAVGAGGDGAGGGANAGSGAESVSEDQVRRDIDEAMADAELSWGGVKRTETRRLELDTPSVDDVDSSSLENVEATTVRSSGDSVDDALSNLRKLQGREQKTDASTGVDDQTAALTELRKQQQAEEVATEDEEGLVDRVRGLFSE